MRTLFLLLVIVFASCKNDRKISEVKKPKLGVVVDSAMVVSARAEASRIGLNIMKEKGGNAFDAMIATEFALAVVFPYAGNLGGGGFMVYRTQYGEVGALDYREKAPMAATKDMYLDDNGNFISNKSKTGSLAVGVPGTVAGMFAVHERHGSLPMEEIIAPVIKLAAEGYYLTAAQAKRYNKYAPIFEEVNDSKSIYSNEWKENDLFVNTALAETFKRIAVNGRQEFYQGKTADILVNFLSSKKGIITKKDLSNYEAVWREPVIFNYKDLKIISMAPPSSGGICLAQILNAVEEFPIAAYGHNQPRSMQVIIEASRRAYADRSHFLGDPDFVEIPVDSLISPNYLKGRMQEFSFDQATTSTAISNGTPFGQESTETTHYSIVDSFGNAIAATTTLNAAFGSKVYSNELGFFFNNEMDDFSAKPGEPNMFGLIGGEANAIEPQKRMLSSMTPTIVEKNGEFWMSVGSPGGSQIITSVMQTILNVYEYDMTMQDAVNAPRFHHQWLPDEVMVENYGFDEDVLKTLTSKGYQINYNDAPVIGKVDAILRKPNGSLEGGADHRGDDTAVGF
ncbi:MAG: gamma-glutamyltranspeptidase/glutathione hydrolase [Planctomycetota bacterium]|jgi:gamma-glutamyltranspeptidase/glutathione hydrolase|uniref:gamma-glutamyltransferase n=1 Tax=Patiriisocius sp. Uisw_047 TaxID=3230969 RepID=UPI0039EA8673